MSSLTHGYLTDERLKIRPSRLLGEVRRLLGRCGEVEVILFSRIRIQNVVYIAGLLFRQKCRKSQS